jgi:hypothetical protein
MISVPGRVGDARRVRPVGWVGLGLAAFLGLGLRLPAADAGVRFYSGACDASAVAAASESVFAAASDESSTLKLYRRGMSGPPLREIPLAAFLGGGRRNEPDFEGAARIGDRIYWIGSHSRNDQGEARVERHVLVATVVRGSGVEATLAPAGRPFRGLVSALAAEPALATFDLAGAARRPGEAPGALNIEGLAEGPEGALWIAFRNPVPQGLALIVPLLNPQEVTGPNPARPRFGPPIRLDLGGAGIRDLARVGGGYLVVAGPAEGGGRHRLYSWKGGADRPVETPKAIPKGFQIEGLLVSAADASQRPGIVEGFSDDGGEKVGGKRCEDLPDPGQRRFRSVTVAARDGASLVP